MLMSGCVTLDLEWRLGSSQAKAMGRRSPLNHSKSKGAEESSVSRLSPRSSMYAFIIRNPYIEFRGESRETERSPAPLHLLWLSGDQRLDSSAWVLWRLTCLVVEPICLRLEQTLTPFLLTSSVWSRRSKSNVTQALGNNKDGGRFKDDKTTTVRPTHSLSLRTSQLFCDHDGKLGRGLALLAILFHHVWCLKGVCSASSVAACFSQQPEPCG